jgi:hypothetical protein
MLTNVKIKAEKTGRDFSFPLHTEKKEEILPLVWGVIEMNFTEEETFFTVTIERIIE